MLKLIKKLHFAWYMLMVAIFFYLLYPLFYYSTRKFSRYIMVGKLRHFWSSCSFYFAGIFYKITYEEELNPSKTYVYVANHTSYVDTPLICIIATGRFHFMGKIELLKNPVLKLFFKSIDVPVDRASKIGSYRAMKRVEENIKNGTSIILYPEGTMSLNAPEMGDFKIGAFKMAVDNQVEIVPVSFLNNYKILKGSGKEEGSTPGLLRAYVHAPISTLGLKTDDDIEKLKQNIVNLIKKKVNSYANQ